MTDQEKVELLNKLVDMKHSRDKFFGRFDDLFGILPGFPGSSYGSFDVFNQMFNELTGFVAEKIGDTKDGVEWFLYDNECGEEGMKCAIGAEEFSIKNAEDYIKFLNFGKENN